MKLYLDVGNSRVKWRDDSMSTARVAESLEVLSEQWEALEPGRITRVVGSCVRGRQTIARIDQFSHNCFDLSIRWLISSSEACGVKNAYAVPESLGIDRWAVLIAARARYSDENCVVVDAGTAITVDYLDASGQHRGGVIMPGAQTMLNSLQRAEQLFPDTSKDFQSRAGSINALARTTDEALLAGVVFAVQGGVKAVITQQAKQFNVKIEMLPIILTGGDSGMIKLDSLHTIPVPDLVLEGLMRLAEH